MNSSRFDLEKKIMDSWQVVEDLQLLYRQSLDGELTPDDWANALLGLSVLYSLRFQELFGVFEGLIEKGAFTPAPIADSDFIPPFLRK